jgi:hypothetical protein
MGLREPSDYVHEDINLRKLFGGFERQVRYVGGIRYVRLSERDLRFIFVPQLPAILELTVVYVSTEYVRPLRKELSDNGLS